MTDNNTGCADYSYSQYEYGKCLFEVFFHLLCHLAFKILKQDGQFLLTFDLTAFVK